MSGLLSKAQVTAADGFPRQFWQLQKEDHVCPPASITGTHFDVACRSASNPVKYFWSGKYHGDESNRGCEDKCVETDDAKEADLLVTGISSGQKTQEKTPHIEAATVSGRRQYTVRYTVESMWHTGKANTFDLMMDMSPFANVPMTFIPDELWSRLQALPSPERLLPTRKLAVWAASNCKDASYARTEYAEALSAYIPIDFPGRCLHNMDLPNSHTIELNVELYKGYLFAFAFENTLDNVNIDEKVYLPWLANSVPVVISNDVIYHMGAGNRSFIDATKFESPKALAEYLLWLKDNPDEYLKFFEYRKQREPRLLKHMYKATANFVYMPKTKDRVMCRLCSCLCSSECLAKRESSECGYSQTLRAAQLMP